MSKFKKGDKIIFRGKKGEIVNIFNFDGRDPIYHIMTYEDASHYKTTCDCFKKLEEQKIDNAITIEKDDFLYKITKICSNNEILDDVIKPNQKSQFECTYISLQFTKVAINLVNNIFGDNKSIIVDRETLIDKIIHYTMPDKIIEIFKDEENDIEFYMFITLSTGFLFLDMVNIYFGEKND